MYQDFYGLKEPPFELTPNPRFLFMTPRHQEAMSNLEYGLSTSKSVTVMIGEAGTGKTTLLHAAFKSPSCRNVRRVYINNPTLTREEFIAVLARQFDLSLKARTSKAELLAELEHKLTAATAAGESVALVIDEAQRLSDELLEEVRLLANIETPDKRLLALVLAGQPELAGRLNYEGLRQLKQRVALRCEISPFDLRETASYIAHRIRRAGGEPLRLFTREAVSLIHQRSRGIPRTISVLCENALLSGYAQGVAPVSRSIVLEICRDFDLEDTAAQPAPAQSQDDRKPVLAPETPAEDVNQHNGWAARSPTSELPQLRRFSLFRR
jgi:general secretion pathway protein A